MPSAGVSDGRTRTVVLVREETETPKPPSSPNPTPCESSLTPSPIRQCFVLLITTDTVMSGPIWRSQWGESMAYRSLPSLAPFSLGKDRATGRRVRFFMGGSVLPFISVLCLWFVCQSRWRLLQCRRRCSVFLDWTVHFSSVQFSSRWYLCGRKSPYVCVHPVSQKFPQRRL